MNSCVYAVFPQHLLDYKPKLQICLIKLSTKKRPYLLIYVFFFILLLPLFYIFFLPLIYMQNCPFSLSLSKSSRRNIYEVRLPNLHLQKNKPCGSFCNFNFTVFLSFVIKFTTQSTHQFSNFQADIFVFLQVLFQRQQNVEEKSMT